MRPSFLLLNAFLLAIPCAFAQNPSAEKEAVPIQDNSFLVEEAYNQEAGVVQHINTFTRLWNSNQWAYTFTQEWPIPEHARHQVSYTLTQAKSDPSLKAGFGDVLFNYRYQVVGSGETRVAVAPRLTLIVPTGSWKDGSGYGGSGIQSCLPASVVLKKKLVMHSNLGGTWVPSSKDQAGDSAASYGYFAGQSFVWLAHQRINLLFETVWNSAHLVSGPHATQSANTLWLLPGVRWSHNFKSGLQIVPGVGVVAGAGPSQGDRGVFLYLSFEHPMWKDSK